MIKQLNKSINEVYQKRHLEAVTSSIIASQVMLHYQDELMRLKSPYYKHNMKKHGSLFQKELIKAEEREFDKVFDSDEETTHKVSSNLMSGMEFILKNGFSNMMFLMKCEMVFKENPKRIEKLVDKLLKEYNLTSN
jgi:uncharacterized membrane-anchored protein YjiN (DUF445 family)